MAVYDRDRHKVGTVKVCYLVGEDLGEAALAPDSSLAGVPRALLGQLEASGFIEIAPGPLAAHRYAAGHQSAAVDTAGVHPYVSGDELPKK